MATKTSNEPPIPFDAQASFVRYYIECSRVMARSYNMRERMQVIDRTYQREMDYTQAQQRARRYNEGGDASKMQNIVVPVVMPQVESLLSELSEIFLTSYPLFPVFSKPDMQDAALMMETAIGEQGIQFGWAAELLQAMRDSLKYNLCVVECVWENKKVWSVQDDALSKNGQSVVADFAGNALRRLDPYNVILDTRVEPFKVAVDGEYAGYVQIMSRIKLKMFIAELDPTRTMNVKAAFESGIANYTTSTSGEGFFIPQINPFAMIDPGTMQGIGNSINWHSWAGLEQTRNINYSTDVYEVAILYARVIPTEHRIHKVSNRNAPQIWKMIIINRKICIFAEPQTNAHNLLPIIVSQATEEGISWQSKSFADNAAPMQALATSLYMSGIESQRKKVYDRMLYDPSRVNKADIENTSPVARIAVKQEAYGKPLSEAVYAFPYRDDQAHQIFLVADQVVAMADIVNGQNRVQRGQFQKGNKTRGEFTEVMDKSSARPRMTALVLENRLYTPIKHILKLNTLQFQQTKTLFNRNTKEEVAIDPTQLRAAAIEFRMADGLMPTDAFINMELFKSILNIVSTFPMILQQWDIIGMIMYWMKLEGATWIQDFQVTAQPAVLPAQPSDLQR